LPATDEVELSKRVGSDRVLASLWRVVSCDLMALKVEFFWLIWLWVLYHRVSEERSASARAEIRDVQFNPEARPGRMVLTELLTDGITVYVVNAGHTHTRQILPSNHALP
jgi:hypothetical protein